MSTKLCLATLNALCAGAKVLGECLGIIYRAIETDLIKRAGLSNATGAKGARST